MTLTTDKQMLIEQRIANDAKSAPIAYLLWFFTGWFGGHRFYLGHTGQGVALLVLTVLGLLTSVIFIGAFVLIGVGIWVLVDAFLIPGIIQKQKDDMRQRLTVEAGATPVSSNKPADEITA